MCTGSLLVRSTTEAPYEGIHIALYDAGGDGAGLTRLRTAAGPQARDAPLERSRLRQNCD